MIIADEAELTGSAAFFCCADGSGRCGTRDLVSIP
jgi:hypothetical protein